MPFLRSGLRAVLPVAITTAVAGTLLAVPPAGAAPTPPVQVSAELTVHNAVAGPSTADPSVQVVDRFIVTFSEEADTAAARNDAIDRVGSRLGMAVEEVRETSGGAVIVEAPEASDPDTAGDVASVLNADPAIDHAEPDIRLRPLAAVNDSFSAEQWNLYEPTSGIRVQGAWDQSSGRGQTIAILDTGITKHTDLDANVLPGYDFVVDPVTSVDGNGRDADASDPGDACTDPEPGYEPEYESSWHGTHVAGIAAAVGNNGNGIVGVAYGAKLLPLRVMGACGGYLSDTIDAVRWAAGDPNVPDAPVNPHPARVINMSLGSEGLCSPLLQSAINFAVGKGSVVVAAAGNESQPAADVLPANCKNVITVGATSRAGDSASYSNYGPPVDVSAPGGDGNTGEQNILSTLNSGALSPARESYAYMQGTSMAAPHVAGVAALMLSTNPALNPAQVEQMLRDSARPFPGTCARSCGTGIVDANAAVARAAGTAFTPSLRSSADIVAADAAGTLWNYPANGRGGFLPRERVGSGWSTLKTGFVTDWNSDGVLDIVAQWKDGRLTFHAGRYAGGFASARSIGSGWGGYTVTVGKWRAADRFPGIVAADANGALWFYGNSAGGSLSQRTGIGAGWRGLHLTMADFDGDSRMDIIAKHPDGKLVQYRSDGAGRFLPETRRTIGTGWSGINSVTNLPGFKGVGQQGMLTRLADGKLAYYPYANARWGTRSIVGSGWGSFNIFR